MGYLRSNEDRPRVSLRTRHTIGRGPSADLVLSAGTISNTHAVLTWIGEAWILRDLGSRNGTWMDGQRIEAGKDVAVVEGAQLGFGAAQSETWTLEDASAPVPFARCIADGALVSAAHGVIEVPGAAIYRERGSAWLIERAEATGPVFDGDVVVVDMRPWRICLPTRVAPTRSTNEWHLDHILMRLRVSSDEEHIEVQLVGPAGVLDIPHRNHHYLLVHLARERLAQGTDGTCGWTDRDLVLGELRITDQTYHQYVHRARRSLVGLGVHDADRIIERRAGSRKLRIGVARLEIERL